VKKIIVAVLLLGLAIGASALDMSVGAGAALNFTSGTMKFSGPGVDGDVTAHFMPANFVAFFDATYVQVSAGYMFYNGVTATSSGSPTTVSVGGSASYLSFAVYGKYPFSVGQFTIFPLLGVEYKLNLTATDENGKDKSTMTSQEQADLNELWFEAGVGADFSFGRFYVRPEMLIGFKPLSSTDNDAVKAATVPPFTSGSMSWFTMNVEVLVGYKL
jgi:hypothetical protein